LCTVLIKQHSDRPRRRVGERTAVESGSGDSETKGSEVQHMAAESREVSYPRSNKAQ
jgi:hypothetical protein